jgi:dienelactone hydrolase
MKASKTGSSLMLFMLLFLAVETRASEPGALTTGMQTLPGALPALADKPATIDWNFDLSQEKFSIFVPRNYKGNEPFGLLVFLSPDDVCVVPPPGWEKILQEQKLIFVAPQKVGNNQNVSRRVGLAILAAVKMQELAAINTNRIYASGFSGGARMASYAAFIRPSLFSGVLGMCGAQFPAKVPRVQATRTDDYGWFTLDAPQVAEAKKKVRFVLITGANDFRYGNILDIFNGGFQKDGYDVKLIDVPGMQHTTCPASALRDGILFLDQKSEAAK